MGGANCKGFTCKLRDNRSELVRVSSLEPESSAQEERVTCDGVCGFVEHSPASVIKWKISSHDPGITVVGSELTGLGGLLYNDEVDSCFVELGCVDVCKASEPCSGNQAVGFIVNFYALVLTLRSFQSLQSDTQNFRPLVR